MNYFTGTAEVVGTRYVLGALHSSTVLKKRDWRSKATFLCVCVVLAVDVFVTATSGEVAKLSMEELNYEIR